MKSYRVSSMSEMVAAVLFLAAVSVSAIAPNPEISAGKQKVQNSTMVAFNVGGGYTRLLWYFNDTTVQWPYNNKQTAYQIQTSANSTTGTDGTWSTVITMAGNTRNTREHTFDFAGMSWVRMYNAGGLIAPTFIEIHDVSHGCEDTWFFMGNSITNISYARSVQPNYHDDIHARFPSYDPVMVDGGIGGDKSANGVGYIDGYLADFPDMKYWALEYGTNDCWNNVTWNTAADPTGFTANMQIIIGKIIAAGRVPIIARIPYSDRGTELATVPIFNTAIDTLDARNGLIPGPDTYAWFKAHPNELDNTEVHPNDTGKASLNRLWADEMAALRGMYSETEPVISTFIATPPTISDSGTTQVTFSARVFPRTTHAITSVTADLSLLGGSSHTALAPGAENGYTCVFTPPSGVPSGPKAVTIVAVDDQGIGDTGDIVVRVRKTPPAVAVTNIYTDAQTYPGFGLSGDSVSEVSTGALEGTRCIAKNYTVSSSGTTTFDSFGFVVNNGTGVFDMRGQDSLRLASKFNASTFCQIGLGLNQTGVVDTFSHMSSDIWYFPYSPTLQWQTISIPLQFFTDNGKDLSLISGISMYIIGYPGTSGTAYIDKIQMVKELQTLAGSSRGTKPVVAGHLRVVSTTAGRTIVLGAGSRQFICLFDLKGNLIDELPCAHDGHAVWHARSAGVFVARIKGTDEAVAVSAP